MPVRPLCMFCHVEVLSEDKHLLDVDGWFHELCWWKKECARLTQVIADMKEEGPASGSASWQRNAQHHSLASEPTVLNDEDDQLKGKCGEEDVPVR